MIYSIVLLSLPFLSLLIVVIAQRVRIKKLSFLLEDARMHRKHNHRKSVYWMNRYEETKNKKDKLEILWIKRENSASFSGVRVGFKLENKSKTIGSFSSELIDKYNEIYSIDYKSFFNEKLLEFKNQK